MVLINDILRMHFYTRSICASDRGNITYTVPREGGTKSEFFKNIKLLLLRSEKINTGRLEVSVASELSIAKNIPRSKS